jgi:hypothetical protein
MMAIAIVLLVVSVVFFVGLIWYLFRGPGSSGWYRP